MIDKALEFLKNELNEYLAAQNNMPGEKKVVLTNVATEDGKWAIPNNKMGLSLINIEEERVFRQMKGNVINVNGVNQNVNPEIKLNLYVLISANFTSDKDQTDGVEYLEGLKQISHVITFFQGKYVFTNENSPALAVADPNIQKLIVELYSYSFEQLYNFWSVIGAKYLPSTLYRIRLLRYQDARILDQNPAITNLNLNVGQ